MITRVKYTGPTVHTRSISKAEAEGASFILTEDLEWNQGNRHTVLLHDGLHQTAKEFFDGDDDFAVDELSNADGAEEEKAIERGAAAEAAAKAAAATEEPEGSAGLANAPTKSRTTTSTTTASK